jgi:hypothetical protein
MDMYSPYIKGKREHKSRHWRHRFRGCFEGFSCCRRAVHIRLIQQIVAQISRCYLYGWVVQQYKIGMFSKVEFVVENLGVVSGFLLPVNVILLLICTFLKLYKSLSLFHWVSPHWGFPWHYLNF